MKNLFLGSLCLIALVSLSRAANACPPAAPPPAPKLSEIVFFEINVSDLKRAKAFYGSLLDVKFSPGGQGPDGVGYEMMKTEKLEGLIAEDKAHKGGSSTVIYFTVGNLTAAYNKALALGAKKTNPEMPPQPVPNEPGHYFAVVIDPDGNRVGFASMVK